MNNENASKHCCCAAAVGLAGTALWPRASTIPRAHAYYAAFKGKKVAFVPIAMGFDLTEGWAAGMQEERSSRSA